MNDLMNDLETLLTDLRERYSARQVICTAQIHPHTNRFYVQIVVVGTSLAVTANAVSLTNAMTRAISQAQHLLSEEVLA